MRKSLTITAAGATGGLDGETEAEAEAEGETDTLAAAFEAAAGGAPHPVSANATTDAIALAAKMTGRPVMRSTPDSILDDMALLMVSGGIMANYPFRRHRRDAVSEFRDQTPDGRFQGR